MLSLISLNAWQGCLEQHFCKVYYVYLWLFSMIDRKSPYKREFILPEYDVNILYM